MEKVKHICNPSSISKYSYGSSSTYYTMGLLPDDKDLLKTEDDIPWIDQGSDFEHCDLMLRCTCGKEWETEEELFNYLKGLVND